MVSTSGIVSSSSSLVVALALLLLAPGAAAESLELSELAERPVVSVESPSLGKPELGRLREKLGVQIGKPVDMRRLDDGIRAVHGEGRYQTLFVEALREGSGVKLVLRGAKVRRLRKVTFTNVDGDVLDDVRRKIKFAEGETADMRAFGQLRERLKAAYDARGYYFADVQIVINDAADSDDADVEVTVQPGEPTLVGKVSVTGVSPSLATRLRELVSLKRNDRFSKAALDESTDAINKYLRANQYPTSKVDDTALAFSQNRLVVDIDVRIRLGERFQFIFSGNTVFESQELRELLTEEVLSQTDASQKIAALIEAKYRAVGYHFVKVTPKAELDAAEKLNVVRFEIREGAKVLIDRLHFLGAEEAEGDSLAKLFYDGAPGVLARGVYWEAGLPEALASLQKELQARGYLSAVVSVPKAVFSDDRKGVHLYFDVDLGTQTRVGGIDVKGAKAIPPDEIASLMGIKPGRPLNRAKVDEGIKAVRARYQSEGYVDVKVVEGDETIGLSSDRKSAEVRVRIEEGTQFTVGNVTIEGNRKTEDKIIRREMELFPGDKFDPVRLRRSEENIAVLGLFSQVEIVPSTSASDPKKKDLKVVVRETKPGLGEVGVGALYEDPLFRVRSFVGVSYRNVGGTNQTLSVRGELALPYGNKKFPLFTEFATILGYRAPYPFDLPFTLSSTIGLDRFELQALPDAFQLQQRARIEGKIERRLAPGITGLFRFYRFEKTTTESLLLSTNEIDPGSVKNEDIGSLGPGLILDFRDDLFNPTRGSYHTIDFEYADRWLRSDPNIGFVMALSRNTFFVPLISPLSFTAFLGFGVAQSISGSLPTARLLNDLSLGGQTTIRGFDLRVFSPYNSTAGAVQPTRTGFYNGRFELASYLFSGVSAAIFFDTGQIFPNFTADRRNDGVGVGFRYKTPVGPVVLDIAQGLGPNKGAVKFYFTVGTL